MPQPIQWLINVTLLFYFGIFVAIFLWPLIILSVNAAQPAIDAWYKLWLGG